MARGQDTPLLEMHCIVKTFPGVRALDGVDLDVRAGEVHCLLGQNGAGKSTLIKVLAGLVSFFNPGAVVIGGEVAAGLGHPLLAEIRSVVYRRSLPLATGNLPVVLSELGSRAGVTGAAVLASDTAFEQAS